jgi:hypothetical protein
MAKTSDKEPSKRAKKPSAKKAATKKAATKKTAAKKTASKKTTAKKAVAKKAPAKKKAVARKKTAGKSSTATRHISAAERHQMIAEAAYLRGEAQGFLSDQQDDWLLAEAEVDALLAKAGAQVSD